MEDTAARKFGPYVLLTELGRGGQGEVWLAEDTRLGRNVALKFLHAMGGERSEGQDHRFRREAESAGKLDHPNICALLDADQHDGIPYLAYRYVKGETLAARIERTSDRRAGLPSGTNQSEDGTAETAAWDPRTREGIEWIVQTFEKLGDALHTAHEHGLIHRDIKPGNIMISESGEPVILDFGLVRDELADEPSLTHSGDLLGTPAYMSPEQITAQRIPVDRRADIYSLGATLYETMTLRRPFNAATRADLYRQILTTDPSPCRSENGLVPRDLEVVLETSLEKDRNRRYQTALDFAEDLGRVRRFERILARPVPRLLRLKRWCQRNTAVATASFGTLILLVGALIATLLFVDQKLEFIREQKALVLIGFSQESKPKHPKLATRLALSALESDPENSAALSQVLAALSVSRESDRLDVGELVLSRLVDISPDGKSIAIGGENPRLWYRGGEVIELSGHEKSVGAVRFSPSGEFILSCGDDGRAILRDRTGRQIDALPHDDEVWFGAFSPNYKRGSGWILTTTRSDAAYLWGPDRERRDLKGTLSPEFSPRFERDGLFVTASSSGDAWIWHRDGSEPIRLATDGQPVGQDYHDHRLGTTVQFSPTGDCIMTLAPNVLGSPPRNQVRVFDTRGGKLAHFGPGYRIFDAAFSQDGQRIVTAHRMAGARTWDRQGTLLDVNAVPTVFHSARFSADNESILVASFDQIGRLFTRPGLNVVRFAGHSGRVMFARFLQGEDQVLTGSDDGTLRLWDVSVPGLPAYRRHEWAVTSIVFYDDHHFVSSSEDETTRRWDTGNRPRSVSEKPIEGRALDTYRDGRVVVGRLDGSIVVFDQGGRPRHRFSIDMAQHLPAAVWHPNGNAILVGLKGSVSMHGLDGEEIGRFVAHEDEIRHVSFSPRFEKDGRILTASDDRTARLWRWRGSGPAELLLEFPGHGGRVEWAEFSPDGTRIVTASTDVRFWSSDNDKDPIWIFQDHEGSVHSARFCPAETPRILTASRDGTARILDFDGKETLLIRSLDSFFKCATFTPDGQSAVTGSAEGTIRFWPLDPEIIRKLAVDRAGEYSPEERARFEAWLPKQP